MGAWHILGEMAKAPDRCARDVATTAPRITIINVPKEKIREVIGTGGKVIRRDRRADQVQDRHRRRRHDQDRRGRQRPRRRRAIDWIRGNRGGTGDRPVIYNGKVVKTADFGAFVNFLGSKDGLVPYLGADPRVASARPQTW